MQYLQKMNTKLSQGYKLTNLSCTVCRGVTMAMPETASTSVYCPKCNKDYQPELDPHGQEDEDYDEMIQEIERDNGKIGERGEQRQLGKVEVRAQEQVDKVEKEYEEFLRLYNEKTAGQERSNEISKKIGQKLISGWSMLEESCLDCNAPLMKSRAGVSLCCGCDRDFSAVIEKSKNTSKNDKLIKLPEVHQPKIVAGKVNNQGPSKQDAPKKQPLKYSTHAERIASISDTALDFLQAKLRAAVELNDIDGVRKILQCTKLAKQLTD